MSHKEVRKKWSDLVTFQKGHRGLVDIHMLSFKLTLVVSLVVAVVVSSVMVAAVVSSVAVLPLPIRAKGTDHH